MTLRQALVATCTLLAAVVSADAQNADSTKLPADLRLSAMTFSARRSTQVGANTIRSLGVSLRGVEFMAKDPRAGGILVRYISGGSGSMGSLALLESALLIGGRTFALTAGYAQRTYRDANRDRRVGMARGGFESERYFGGSGAGVHLAATYYRTVGKESAERPRASAGVGEVSGFYVPRGLPLMARLGFRRELYTAELNPNWDEDISGIFLAIGIQSGLRVR